jgi:signal transduction histidine kinase
MALFTKEGQRKSQQIKLKVGLVAGAIVGITLLHLSLGIRPLSHQIYSKLYYGPLILAGFWFGVRGGLFASVVIDLLLGFHLFVDSQNFVSVQGWTLLEIPTLNLAGLVIGYLADMAKKKRRDLEKVGHLVSLGKRCSYLSHEMRNISVGIHGLARLARRKVALPEDGVKFLQIIEKESKRMERLTKNLLSFSHPPTLRKTVDDIRASLSEVVWISQEMAAKKGIRFTGEVQEDLPRVYLDWDRMKEVLINLTQNAIHATPTGGAVVLRAFGNNGTIQIQVSDTGTGIPSEDLEKIFLPFFTRKREGTGLGLAVSKRIVEAHGATLEVAASEAGGTTFTVGLPIERVRGVRNFKTGS